MAWLFRSMIEDRGLPRIGASARELGIRPAIDVPAVNVGDTVTPGQGGLSVTPDDPILLPEHRRPKPFHGTGKDPVWMLDSVELPPDLEYRPDPDDPTHGWIEPSQAMTLGEFQTKLAQLQHRWQKTDAWPIAGVSP